MILKKIFLLISFIGILSLAVTAQSKNDYELHWKSVENFEKNGLTKSALKKVLVIYQLAKKDNNDAQQILACMFQIKYRSILQEDSQTQNIFFVDTLIAASTFPAKNILQSMQAEMYQQYLQEFRYRFYGRTKLQQENSKDISTWSIDKLHSRIAGLYQASLINISLLQKTMLTDYSPIIIKGENTRHLRPTLYDFLAHRALDYFMSEERMLTKPAEHFTLQNNNVFLPAVAFATASFITNDSTALHYKAILLLQQLIQFHLQDKKPDALLDADLKRIAFVYQYSVAENKTALYEAALQQIENNFTGNAVAAQASYLRAKIYFDEGQNYDPFLKPANQYQIKKAKELCETVVAKFPKSEGGINCSNLINEILQPILSMETEKVNTPLQAFRSLIKYKNAGTVYFRLIKINREQIININRKENEKKWTAMADLPALKSWNTALPDPKDFQNHSTEIKIEALNNGRYLLLASLDEKFSLQKNIIAKQDIYVSNISYLHNNNEYYVLHRTTGQPLAGCKVQLWESKYNYTYNQYEDSKTESYITDKNGSFNIIKSASYRSFNLQIINKDDELFLDENNYNETYNSYQEPYKPVSFLFTDRSIYRPGQILYFKGIVLKKQNDKTNSQLLVSFTSAVQLLDANGQKINEIKLTTNDFGSYHGSFKIPEGLLNGQFSLYDSTTNAFRYFNVEEYKRPKFFTKIKTPTGSYRVNDSIHVTGTATAFAGNAIDGAKVKYRVVRKVHYPIWWSGGFYQRGRSSRLPYNQNPEVEITNGETSTDNMGNYKIIFKALPDESINKKDQPIFYYEVNADVTDINGETRSGSSTIKVAYQALQLEIKMADQLAADSFNTIYIHSSNINDINVRTITSISIQQLISPDKIFRERYWQQPDLFLMNKEEYYAAFPLDIYKNENEVANYEKGKIIYESTDSSNQFISFSNTAFKAGWYKVSAVTTDKYGEAVKAEKFILLTSDNLNEKSPFSISSNKKIIEPGEKIQYQIQTSFDKIFLIHTLVKMNEKNTTSYKNIQSGKAVTEEILVTENDRGGMAANYVFIKNNRVYKGSEMFEIPWNNKDLIISYESFRDKLLPGAEEKLTVKISGSKGEKVAAELLAGMYDASLDEFRNHEWGNINIWPGLVNNVSWVENGFAAVNSEEYNSFLRSYLSVDENKTYDRLLSVTPNMALNYRTKIRGQKTPDAMLSGRVAGVNINKMEDGSTESVNDSVGQMIGYKTVTKVKEEVSKKENPQPQNDNIQIRKNFNETAFFFPDLKTDEAGNVSFRFTMPEALTSWKLMALAHTKNLASGYSEKMLMTQKPLMIQPNTPRFFRQGDQLEFSVKIINLDTNFLAGKVVLELVDANTNLSVDARFNNSQSTQYFSSSPGQSIAVKFPISIPLNFNSVVLYRIKAIAEIPNYKNGETFSDGEEMAIPVLPNRMLVTESLPINVRGVSKKDFKFEKLIQSSDLKNSSISNHALTVEYSSNPAWYAVQALPYLMEYPYECAEQTFNRYYANTLATHITNSTPKLKAVFAKWISDSTEKLVSALEKNEELKSVLLQETPWVLDAKNETQQKKNIALLFDLARMSKEQNKAIEKLKEMQNPGGGFVWFKGGPDDRYITQYILTGIGHLIKLKAVSSNQKEMMEMVGKALPYLDNRIKMDYENLIKFKVNLKNNNLNPTAIQYLYMRSFFTDNPVNPDALKAYHFYLKQAQQYWLQNGKYLQAMIALTLHRNADIVTPVAIIKSLKENAINHDELGMYWKEWTSGGYYWQQAPIESQAMMIEAFMDIDKNNTVVDDLKTWLLKQKQTQNWKTTRATAEACYALLLGGNNWLAEEKEVQINLGGTIIKSSDFSTSAGTGYFKKRIEGENVNSGMGNISVEIKSTNNSSGSTTTSWGSVYWQYFQDLDKITTAATPLKLDKKLFVERNSDRGPVLEPVSDSATLMVGDKVKVRIELRVDRDMEYVHMKDMRASCMEPINVLSGYKYQGGLGYYESTKDANTNFFFSYLARGTYVFEYPMFVTHTGNFSNGITNIQCMYAPEFSSHSEGIRITVNKAATIKK